jgi:hypothetical protein
MKICPVGAELFYADRQMDGVDMTRLVVALRDFVKATTKKLHTIHF